MTLGRRGERHFILMAGIGYDAFALEAALARARGAGRKVGFHDYALSATLGARDYPFPRFRVKAGEWSGGGAWAFAVNCPRYGANMRIAPRARLEDPFLDLVVLPEGRFAERLRYFIGILAGTLEGIPGVVCRKVSEMTVQGAEEGIRIPCQLDGEVSEPLPAAIRAVPGALHLLRMARGS